MKKAAVALGLLATSVSASVGLEGAFLLIGTILLAVGSSFLSPVGPWFVVGGMAVVVGLALAIPRT